MAETQRILLIEDDFAIATELSRGLRERGYRVELAMDGARGLELALQGDHDLLVLDLMLPEVDGLTILERVSAHSTLPVIVLTARTSLPTRLQAFRSGAADYLAKPFFVEELVVRIQARLGHAARPTPQVTWADATLDLPTRTVTVAGKVVGLTAHEFNVLAWLTSRPGMAATRQQIAEAALSADGETQPRTLDSHIARVRKKLGPAGEAVRTVWGVGYKFDPEPA